MRRLRVAFPVMTAFGLASCAASPPPSAPPPIDQVVVDRLGEAASKAADALRFLSEIERSRSPGPRVAEIDLTVVPTELVQPLSLSWVGPVRPVVELLADKAGYRFLAVGHAPKVPLIVSITATREPIVKIIQDLGLQVSVKADVVIDAAAKTVELRYASRPSL